MELASMMTLESFALMQNGFITLCTIRLCGLATVDHWHCSIQLLIRHLFTHVTFCCLTEWLHILAASLSGVTSVLAACH